MTADSPASARFPRSARLLVPAQFKACFETRQRVSGRYFRVHVAPADEGPSLGLAVSRKVSRRAVVRNRIKRTVRESFRHARPTLPALAMVFLAKPEAASASADQLRDDLVGLWRRMPALKRSGQHGTMRAGPAGADSAAPDTPISVSAGASAPGTSRSTPE